MLALTTIDRRKRRRRTGVVPRSTTMGDLRIKGVTRRVELELSFDGVTTDPWNNTKVGLSAEGEINRKDFGIDFNVALETGGVLVGEKIKIQLDIQLVKAQAAA